MHHHLIRRYPIRHFDYYLHQHLLEQMMMLLLLQVLEVVLAPLRYRLTSVDHQQLEVELSEVR
jgi:hypothetical protein